MISAKVIADSLNIHNKVRLVTVVAEYPRYIHSEVMTHRVFSRNASSSRAEPVAKLIDRVENNPVFPLEWGSNKPGMQAGSEIEGHHQAQAKDAWGLALLNAVKSARQLKDLGVHKQITNRLLEPFATIKVIITSTEWDNFFNLRISNLAQPEIKSLAMKIAAAMDTSEPVLMGIGGENLLYTHIPYIQEEERKVLNEETCMMISAARCARVSYFNHDGAVPDVAKDMVLANKLFLDKHASCFEHQASAVNVQDHQFSGNLRGWFQFRKMKGL